MTFKYSDNCHHSASCAVLTREQCRDQPREMRRTTRKRAREEEEEEEGIKVRTDGVATFGRWGRWSGAMRGALADDSIDKGRLHYAQLATWPIETSSIF